ncbi:hypothetical protein ACHWQZ_G011177 [Mnemiopsis leidyi]
MKLLKKLRKNASCCIPVRSSYHLNSTDHPLYTLPEVGRPRKTSTPVGTLPSPVERYTKRSEPRSLESLTAETVYHAISTINAIEVRCPPPTTNIQPPSIPVKPARSKKTSLKKKSDPRGNKKKTIVVPEKTDLSHLLPVDELHDQPRNCDLECIVCALAKPELRTRHHCTSYRPCRI